MRAARLLRLAYAAAAVGSVPLAGAAAPISRSEAARAPVDQLVRCALAGAARHFVQVTRPSPYPRFKVAPNVSVFRAATAPISAGEPGLCSATTLLIDPSSDQTPLLTAKVYKVVDDLKPVPGIWNERYGKRLFRKCAEAGRVIPEIGDEFGEVAFFEVDATDTRAVWRAARAFQIAIEQAKAGAEVACDARFVSAPDGLADLPPGDVEAVESRENQAACERPAPVLAGLALGRILNLETRPCADNAREECATADFLRYAVGNRRVLWSVTLRLQGGRGENSDIEKVEAVVLGPSSSVYD